VGRRADAVEVVDRQVDSGLVGDGEQVQDRVGDPPKAITTAMALSKASRVRMSRAVMPRRNNSTTASPERRANPSRRASTAGGAALPGSDMPSASPALAIVLAVYMPPQAPCPGRSPLDRVELLLR
jgi:hypothetical protein